MPITKTDLFRQAGYSERDSLTQYIALPRTSKFSVTSSSFQVDPAQEGRAFHDLSSIPDTATVRLRGIIKTGGVMDTTGDYKIQVDSNSQGVTDTTVVSTSNTFELLATETTEVTQRTLVEIVARVRSNGTDTVSLFGAGCQIEVQL